MKKKTRKSKGVGPIELRRKEFQEEQSEDSKERDHM